MTVWLAVAAAVALSPLPRESQASALFRAGQARYQSDDPSGALQLFQASYRLVPVPILLVDLAQCQRKLGRADEAADSYRRFLESRAGSRALRSEVWEALDELKAAPAAAVGERSPGARARSAALFQRGRARFQAGDVEGALLAFRAALDEFAAPDLYVNIAQCLRRLDRPDEALFAYAAFLDAHTGTRALRAEVWEALDDTLREVDERLYRLAESAAALDRAAETHTDPGVRVVAAASAAQIRQALVQIDERLSRLFSQ